jgi:hypothetical protein
MTRPGLETRYTTLEESTLTMTPPKRFLSSDDPQLYHINTTSNHLSPQPIEQHITLEFQDLAYDGVKPVNGLQQQNDFNMWQKRNVNISEYESIKISYQPFLVRFTMILQLAILLCWLLAMPVFNYD